MVLMVLDHVREFFSDALISPGDLVWTTPGLFLTRWITHFCAPAFVFLAGTGVFLAATRGKTRPELTRFLLTRGFWLIFLEVTVVRLGMTFNLDYRYIPAGVLWAIGWSMVSLAGLIWLPKPLVLGFGVALLPVIICSTTSSRSHSAGWVGSGRCSTSRGASSCSEVIPSRCSTR